MHWLKWVVLGLALFQGGWLVFDGTRALTAGDYVTPRSGPGAGQLGPWSKVISSIGINPRSTFMKWVHVVLGVAWLGAAILFFRQPASAWWTPMACGALSLWYLPIGTVLSVVEIAVLLLGRSRGWW